MVESHGEVDQDKKRADATVVPAAIVAPPTLEPCIRYALQTMLRPHGIELDVVSLDQLPVDHPSVVYAPSEVDVPNAALRFDASPAAADYYDGLPSQLPASTEPLALFADDQGRPDQLASAFFWLSGTQEYVLRPRDEHGRFLHEGSFTEKLDIVDVPVVDGPAPVLVETGSQTSVPSLVVPVLPATGPRTPDARMLRAVPSSTTDSSMDVIRNASCGSITRTPSPLRSHSTLPSTVSMRSRRCGSTRMPPFANGA